MQNSDQTLVKIHNLLWLMAHNKYVREGINAAAIPNKLDRGRRIKLVYP